MTTKLASWELSMHKLLMVEPTLTEPIVVFGETHENVLEQLFDFKHSGLVVVG